MIRIIEAPDTALVSVPTLIENAVPRNNFCFFLFQLSMPSIFVICKIRVFEIYMSSKHSCNRFASNFKNILMT